MSKVVCLYCDKLFYTPRARIWQGKGIYCSKVCYVSHKVSRVERIKHFWLHVSMRDENECWLWKTNSSSNSRYGKFSYTLYGVAIEKGAHVFSYMLHIGKVPRGKFVCHTCDVPKCVNPKHLFLGDALSNMQDKVAKGRHKYGFGESSGNNKLSDADVLEIYRMNGMHVSIDRIAKRFNISFGSVRRILRGETWKHLFRKTFPDLCLDGKPLNRRSIGDHGRNSKFLEEDVIRARSLYESGNYSQREIADIIGMSKSYVHQIVNHQLWTHI